MEAQDSEKPAFRRALFAEKKKMNCENDLFIYDLKKLTLMSQWWATTP